jgi:hypothetical protein
MELRSEKEIKELLQKNLNSMRQTFGGIKAHAEKMSEILDCIDGKVKKLFVIRDCDMVMVEYEKEVYFGVKISPNHKRTWFRKSHKSDPLEKPNNFDFVLVDSDTLQKTLTSLYDRSNLCER